MTTALEIFEAGYVIAWGIILTVASNNFGCMAEAYPWAEAVCL